MHLSIAITTLLGAIILPFNSGPVFPNMTTLSTHGSGGRDMLQIVKTNSRIVSDTARGFRIFVFKDKDAHR